jgi:dTDP-4-dehydrorhamnose reductase
MIEPEKILIIGSGGRLGAALVREYKSQFRVSGLSHAELDLIRLEELRPRLAQTEFDLLINCAALTNVDYCESHPEEAFSVNTDAPRILAEICMEKSARFIHFSTDYVFDGNKRVPYNEEDEPAPLDVYGQSKLDGERAALQVSARFLVVRVSWVFGPDRPSFIDQVVARAQTSSEVAAVAGKISTPTYTLDAARWLRLAWERDIGGLLHLANGGECSWQEYAQHALDCCKACGIPLKGDRVGALSLNDMTNFVARRPVYSVLSTARFKRLTGIEPRGWRQAVAEYVRDHLAKQ